MKTAKQLYPDWEEGYGPCDYQPIINNIGNVVVQVDDAGYQGDTRVLYNNSGNIGFLRFGWGSCSGCDALQACDTFDDVQTLVNELTESVRWFGSFIEALAFFKEHDWAGDYDWHKEETASFVKQVIDYLESL